MTAKQNKRSQFIVDLANGIISIEDALFKLKVLLSNIQNNSILNWIDNEIEGYKSDNVPSYRCLKTVMIEGMVVVGNYQINKMIILMCTLCQGHFDIALFQ